MGSTPVATTETPDAPTEVAPASAALPRLNLWAPPAHWVGRALAAAHRIDGLGTDPYATLDWVRTTGSLAPHAASLTDRWQLLASTAFLDVAAARMLEPHLDALGILNEAHADGFDLDHGAADLHDDATWGVFAAEGPGVRLEARQRGGRWTLTGTKPWCSLASQLSHALVTAWVDDAHRRLFAVSLRGDGVSAHAGPWHARGLPQVVSAPVDFDDVPAAPVGDDGWYLRRQGFAHGGAGVAAAWWGGACGLVPALEAAASTERSDQVSHVHLGDVDAALWAARATLAEAAGLLPQSARDEASVIANRARTVTAHAAKTTMDAADLALGPLPLVADESHARRVADLHLYLRQHHGARDSAKLGRDLVGLSGR